MKITRLITLWWLGRQIRSLRRQEEYIKDMEVEHHLMLHAIRVKRRDMEDQVNAIT